MEINLKEGRINPYATTMGLLLNNEKLKNSLTQYTVISGDLSFGYRLEGLKIYIITGYREEEKEIPLFNHPYLFYNSKFQPSLAIDLRSYCKPDLSKERLNYMEINLDEVLKDPRGVEFVMNRALLVGMVATNQLGYIRGSYKPLMISFGCFVGNICNTMVNLDVVNRITVEVLSCFYFYGLLVNKEQYKLEEFKNIVASQLDKAKLNIVVTRPMVEKILASVDYINTFPELINAIKSNLPDAQASLIDLRVFNSLLGNLWIGPGGNELIPIALDNLATWMIIFYYSLEETTYKRTRIMEIIKKFSLKSISSKSKLEFDEFFKECKI